MPDGADLQPILDATAKIAGGTIALPEPGHWGGGGIVGVTNAWSVPPDAIAQSGTHVSTPMGGESFPPEASPMLTVWHRILMQLFIDRAGPRTEQVGIDIVPIVYRYLRAFWAHSSLLGSAEAAWIDKWRIQPVHDGSGMYLAVEFELLVKVIDGSSIWTP